MVLDGRGEVDPVNMKQKLAAMQAAKATDPASRVRNVPSPYEQDLDMVDSLEEIYERDDLSDWEVDFFESVRDQVRRDRIPLTDPQREKAEEILEQKG